TVVWDVESGKNKKRLNNKLADWLGGGVDPMGGGTAISPDGKTMARQHVGILDQSFSVKIKDLATDKEVAVIKTDIGSAQSLTFSPDGKTLAGSTLKGDVVLWDAATGKELRHFGERPGATVSTIAFSPDGKTVAVDRDDQTVEILEVETGKQIAQIGEVTPRVANPAMVVSALLNGGAG